MSFVNKETVRMQIQAFRGAQGPAGPQGPIGLRGPAGSIGPAGRPGADGVSPKVTMERFSNVQGTGIWFSVEGAYESSQQMLFDGKDYVLTDEDKQEIAGMVGDAVDDAIDALADRVTALEQNGSTGGGGETEPTAHGIVWDLINVTSSNSLASVSHGASLIAVLSAADGYALGDVTITMGGEVVTGAWNADTATITIASVTGDVVISCTGMKLETVDTSPKIAQENMAYQSATSSSLAILSERMGMCVTEPYVYGSLVEKYTAAGVYDSVNGQLMNRDYAPKVKYLLPNTNYMANATDKGYPTSSIARYFKIAVLNGETVVTFNNNSSYANNTETQMSVGSGSTFTNEATGDRLAFTLSMDDIDDSYAYWYQESDTNIMPDGVRSGDIIFAGKNTPYYGLANIDGTKPGQTAAAALSYDDDYAQDYGIATTSILGEDTNSNPQSAYGVSAEMAAAIDEARTSWMIEYGGDYRKIPIIVSTDQHGRRNTGIFNMLGKTLNMYDVSRIMNLGDTVSNWVDADPAHPLLTDASLDAWLESIEAIPFSKRLDVFGNHDTWYSNYADEGNPIGTRYPSSQAHLYQYFRNIYPRRLNNNGWFVNYDDAFNVKYVVISAFEYQGGATFRIGTKQMTWLIDELEKDDGYNVVIVSHVPLHYKTGEMSYPFAHEDSTAQDYRVSELNTDAFFAARKTGGSGTITDSDGVSHTYNFSSVTNTPLLCAIHGHTHIDAYTYVGSELLSYSFDWFDDNTFFFALIDSANSQLNVWKVSAPDNVPQLENYQIPFDKTVSS